MVIYGFFGTFLWLVLVEKAICIHNETSNILRDIFSDYDKRVLPFNSGPVLVNMTIVLGILIELKENQQLAAYVISHTQRWYDERLRWEPALYRGQSEVIVPQSMVWIPKLFVYNSLESKDMLTENRADVRLYHTGRIKINIPQYVQAICRIQTESFPFDCQFCAVALASPLLNVKEMKVNATQPPLDSYFTGNAEWYLFNVTVRHMEFAEEGESRVEVQYIFHLQRRPIYYITVIVAPTFLISALSILGIFSPGSNDGPRNEKVSLGLGSLLAMTVLLGIVAGAMPKSNDIPLLGYYILVVIVLCAVAVGISMAFLAVSRHFIQKEQMPSKRLLRMMFLTEYRKRRSTIFRGVHNYRHSQDCDNQMYSKVPEIQSICNMMEEIADSHRSMRRKADAKANKKLVEKEWSRVFARFDYFFLVVFQTFNLTALAVFLRVAWLPTPELREQIL
ncbi:unnamed protein product [Caenorhabditis angaria]|uniref:Neurotransmitter-gated ion-channel ligand-binding domain-containing protein n=1 Tax=Caenorhabditis angaria TaxID=860376 RepID=A0A9P1IPE0_9PELO|nr:unnamed protein product [Caenorhabditis angaria]